MGREFGITGGRLEGREGSVMRAPGEGVRMGDRLELQVLHCWLYNGLEI